MTDRVVTSEPLPMPTGPPPRGPWVLTAALGVLAVAVLVAIIAIATGDDGGGAKGARRTVPSTSERTPRSSKADGTGSGTGPGSNDGSGSETSTSTAAEGTTTSTSSTGPVISYFTAPTSIVCDPGETVRSVDVTVRAERVTELTVTGPGGASQRLSATATDPTIVGTVPMPASCATPNEFVVTATGSDGSTVERRVTVTGRVRPPAPGS